MLDIVTDIDHVRANMQFVRGDFDAVLGRNEMWVFGHPYSTGQPPEPSAAPPPHTDSALPRLEPIDAETAAT